MKTTTFADSVERRLAAWDEERFLERLHQRDPTLWFPTPRPEIIDRLGWLDLPITSAGRVAEWRAFADDVRSDGIEHVLLHGMGGSSLAPEVFQRVFGPAAGHPRLLVNDTTHPDAVGALDEETPPEETLHVVSSKSGSTTETMSGFRHAWKRAGASGRRFAAITDAGSSLDGLARERGFRAVFNAPSDVGGRFSALSEFGLVPAALLGVDVARLLGEAARMRDAHVPGRVAATSPGLVLAAALAVWAEQGRNKLTFACAPRWIPVTEWIEQLLAESLGKNGQGIVPVVGEALLRPERYASDRAFIHLRTPDDGLDAHMKAVAEQGHPTLTIDLEDPYALGSEFFRWEAATAAAGAVLGVHPFDQPDVQLAKDLAKRSLDGRGRGGWRDAAAAAWVEAANAEELAWAVSAWLQGARERDYVAVQAFLAPTPENLAALTELRAALGRRLGVAVTGGLGPRFLHSTGQLHKGGPDEAFCLQLVDRPQRDVPIPETPHTFGALVRAQAQGDLAALRQRGRRLLPIDVGTDPSQGVRVVARLVAG